MNSLKTRTPLVSVILITYNRKKFLSEAISSILNQTYTNFELIIVDNYSDYDFYSLVESFHSNRIHPYQNHNNGIIAINRNFGIRKSKGELLAFCDDDDIWLPEKLEVQVQFMLNHPVDILGTTIIKFGENRNKYFEFKRERKLKYNIYLYNFLTPSTVILKRNKDILFDETPFVNCAEDWALWLSLVIQGSRYYIIKEPYVKYRVTSSNLTAQNRVQPDIRAIKILTKLKKEYGNEFGTHYYILAIAYHFFKAIVRESICLYKRIIS